MGQAHLQPADQIRISPPASGAHPSDTPRFIARFLLLAILLFSFLLKLHHLDHTALKGLDESFHALVARNLLKHPFTPTLIDHPFLPYDYRDWQANHVWLHKPPVPLWQIALSYFLFGITPLALRLPSAILATASVYLTYALGRRLLSRPAGLIAAALQAFNPALTQLVQGYIFSDHVDVALLFWTELSIYLLVLAAFEPLAQPDTVAPITRSSRRRILLLIACGIATGIAFLCKTYPAFITLGLAFILIILNRSIRWGDFALLVAVVILTILPWSIYCWIRFRPEFLYENLQVFRHFDQNVEGFAAPWDRLVFDFSLRIYYLFYPATLAAALILLPQARPRRNPRLVFIYAWGLGVLIPHLLATSKTPTGTLIGWPPFLLLFAEMVVRSFRRDPACLGALLVSMGLAVFLPGRIPSTGWGYPNPPGFAAIMRQNIWVLYHLALTLLGAVAFVLLFRIRRPQKPMLAIALVASLLALVPMAKMVHLCWRVGQQNDLAPAFPRLAGLVQRDLPKNAVLLFDQRYKLEYIIAMFWIDRTAYPLGSGNWRQIATAVRSDGGIPFIVSSRPLPLTPVLTDLDEGVVVYSPKGHDLAGFSALLPVNLKIHATDTGQSSFP